jgi:hypothetical protein
MTSFVGLSEYEVLRLQNIERNKNVLKTLGLAKLKSVLGTNRPKRVAPKRKKKTVTAPTRHSKRLKSLSAKDYSENNVHLDDGNVSAYSSESEQDVSEDSEESIPRPKRLLRKPSVGTKNNVKGIPTVSSILSVEHAKTGRSRCRKCMVQLEKGELRVGMKAWIMGRNSVTWQHVGCFLRNVKVGVSPNSRSRCKVCSQPFCSGDLRFGLRSHTATAWISAECLSVVLHGVVSQCDKKIKLSDFSEDMEGMETLTKSQCEKIKATLKRCQTSTNGPKAAAGPKLNQVSESQPSKGKHKLVPLNQVELQPEKGKKTKATGRVAWKFGGHVCFGVLLAGRETPTHCYAKTHKGNVKTLTKGKGYWWLQ